MQIFMDNGKLKKFFEFATKLEKLKDYLARHPEIESKLKKNNNHKFLVTDLTEGFKVNAQNWLGQKIELEKVNLE